MSDPTERLKDDIQNLKDKVNRHEQYSWLAGALAVIFGLTGAYGLNAFQTLIRRINEESGRIDVVKQDVDHQLKGPIEKAVRDQADLQVRQLMKGLTDANDTTKPKPKECGLDNAGQISCTASCDLPPIEYSVAVGGYCDLTASGDASWATQNFGLGLRGDNTYHCLWTRVSVPQPKSAPLGKATVLCRKKLATAN